MTEITLHPFTATDRDWLVRAHGKSYAVDEGFDDSFGILVASILDDFLTGHNSTDEAGWIAWQDGARLGSIFCVRLDDQTAKLRLFLLMPETRGQGLGRRLLQTCTDFARKKGYKGMQLWTHESHKAACALYAKTGWVLRNSTPVTAFGQSMVEQTWTLEF